MGSATGAIAWALLLLSPGRGHAEDSDNLADHHAAASASRTAESDEPAASRPSVSMQCTAGTEKSGSGTTANWPTYHFMNNVTKNASGALLLEPLNDANAIAEYKGALLQHDGGLPLLPGRAEFLSCMLPGIFHVMMQEGGGNWSHGVSNDSEPLPLCLSTASLAVYLLFPASPSSPSPFNRLIMRPGEHTILQW